MATRVYKYAIERHAEFPDWVLEQLRLAHELRNKLVEIERDHAAGVAAAWAELPDVAEAEAAVVAATAAVDELVERARKERSKDRTTVARDGTASELKAAKAVLRTAKHARRELKDERFPVAKEAMAELGQARKAAVKACYADFVQDRGLGWASFNDVVDHHRTAVQMVGRKRKAGMPAELRFHRWDGTGTLAVQLQRQAADPARTPALLASGDGRWRNVCQVRPHVAGGLWARLSRSEQRAVARTGQVRLRVATGHTIDLPLVLHRPMPDDADIALVRLTRTRTAGTHRWHVTFTVKLPDPTPRSSGATVAVHTGWRREDDQSIRVATWASTAPIDIPAAAEPFLRATNRERTKGIVVGPARLINKATHPASLRSIRDRNLDITRAVLVDWLSVQADPDLPAAHEVKAWRSPARFAQLALRWRDAPPDAGGEIAAKLEAWRVQDRHLWEWEAAEGEKVVRQRTDLWHQAAGHLLATASRLVVDDINIAGLTRVPDVDTEDPVEQRLARAQRQVGSPGSFREVIVGVAVREGIDVTKAPATGITRTHYECGNTVHVDDETRSIWCDSCATPFDRDDNATRHLLNLAGTPGPASGQAAA